LRVRHRKDQGRPADAAVGDEDLRAVDDVTAAVPDGERLHPSGIGTRIGLGEAEGPDALARGHRRQEAALLLLAAEADDRIDGEQKPDRRADPRDLLDRDRAANAVELGAAECPRRLQSEVLQRLHLFDDFPGKTGVTIDVVGDRTQFGIGKHANRLADHFMLHAGIEIHVFTPNFLSAGGSAGRGDNRRQKINENPYRGVAL
jgi:hypothetical protein